MGDLKVVIQQLEKVLKEMQLNQSEMISKLTDDQKKLVEPMQIDVTNALDALSKGDMNKLTQLQTKYANINNK